MEFQRNTVRRTIKNSMKLRSEYPHSLQLYSVPPSETIGLQELEDWAVERLKGIIIGHNFLLITSVITSNFYQQFLGQ